MPLMPGMAERLDSGHGTFLDVGAGVGAISIALCLRHPRLRAVALELFEAARELAQRNIAAAGLGDRIELRDGRVEEIDSREEFDLIWLPGNFLGGDMLPDALSALHRALRPGGYVVNAVLGGGGHDARAVAARLRSVLWGGDVLDPEHVAGLLSAAGIRGCHRDAARLRAGSSRCSGAATSAPRSHLFYVRSNPGRHA